MIVTFGLIIHLAIQIITYAIAIAIAIGTCDVFRFQ
jgi:hypothetical protein